jgi:rhodanese-related sulfurtransferase
MSPVTKGVKALVAEAMNEIETLEVNEARSLQQSGGALLVDLRDVRELQREGKIPGAFHAPRGMLEFWVDPDSPYHKQELAQADRLVLYCASGWRSALSTRTLHEMGLTNVSHIRGGFTAWRDAGLEIEKLPERKPS